jgi:hypothetical protein
MATIYSGLRDLKSMWDNNHDREKREKELEYYQRKYLEIFLDNWREVFRALIGPEFRDFKEAFVRSLIYNSRYLVLEKPEHLEALRTFYLIIE